MLAEVFWSRVNKNGPTASSVATPCWLWTGAKDGHRGYGHVWIQSRRVGWAHRVAYELAIGPIPRGQCVLHRCDNPACVRAEPGGQGHLFLGTTFDNARDMISKGRAIWQVGGAGHDAWKAKLLALPRKPTRGEDSHLAKLTEEQVLEILAERGKGVLLRVLAHRFGVSEATICRVARRNRWAHVEGA